MSDSAGESYCRKGKPGCIPDSAFRRLTTSFFRAHRVTYQLSPRELARSLVASGTRGREETLGLTNLFGIQVKERTGPFAPISKLDIAWYAEIDDGGNAIIHYPPGKLPANDVEEDDLQAEHEFGHLLYWAMMNYLGRLRHKPRNEFEENYAETFALELRVGEH